MVGIFDLGSNSFIALVLDGKKDIYERVEVTGMAFDVEDGVIRNCGKYREKFLKMLGEVEKCTGNIHVFGTAVFRYTKNGQECFNLIKGELPGRVLTSEEEAKYSYLSVVWDDELRVEKPVVYDLGGGSLEIISKETFKSTPYGTKYVKELLNKWDTETVKEFIKQQLPGILSEAVGIGGTFVTIAAFLLKEWNLKKVHGFVLKYSDVLRIYEKLSHMEEHEIGRYPFIPPGRERTLKPGTVITLAILEKHGKLIISRKGYRYALGWEIEKSVPGGI